MKQDHGQSDPTALLRPGKRIYGVSIGIAIMDRRFPRPVGDLGNPRSFAFPVLYDVVHGVNNMPALSVEQTGDLFTPLYDSCMRLVDQGVAAITTTCGYAALLQERLAEKLPVPFAASSLVQIPSVLALLGGRRRIGVLAARGRSLTDRHLAATGVTAEQLGRIRKINLQEAPAFRRAILDAPGAEPLEVPAAAREIAALCKALADADSEIAGFVAECTNVGPYSAHIQAATGLPVWDSVSLVNWLHAGVARVAD
ncbi:hypothetical protein [Microvirga sp. VF16]|uniref:hypothetical protein n=1 Tax=Microvirga sp. VF16 TaxID=2807101 RepID=UPI00193E9292|nr:hypothetical protein [Microvirga sp. VF16]QRM32796.1 hypothetical protein JO965_25845 [Microvirga sp. VF16]